ncbi:MAG TPA: glycosyl transferase family 2, partial [Deltaproteobacteria bacterium]|nr:glycosyl transferase family 2 [Deltaproteobacteria bacterium]
MSAPLVSVLMPVRNDARILPECLTDLAAQTLRDWELVVVDDGSTDDSPALLKSWADRDARLRIFTTPPQGIVPALNTGLAECRGRFIARMDADDRMRPERLERQ